MHRSTLSAILSVPVLALGAIAIESCSAKQLPDDGGLMVIVTTDGSLEVTSLKIVVWKDSQKTKAVIERLYAKGTFSLPNTLAIVSDGNPATAIIKVIAYNKDAKIVDIRDRIVEALPADRIAMLPIVLSANCQRHVNADPKSETSTCDVGKTCDPADGICKSATVNATVLEPYVPGRGVDAGIADSTRPDSADASDSTVDTLDTADVKPDVLDTSVVDTSDDTLVVDSADSGDSADTLIVADTSCEGATKLCGELCKPTNNPLTGCNNTSCDACPVDPKGKGTPVCSATTKSCTLDCGTGTGLKACAVAGALTCVDVADPAYGCSADSCVPAVCPDSKGGSVECKASACVIKSCGSGLALCGSVCAVPDIVTYPPAPGCPDHVWRCWPPVKVGSRSADFTVKTICGQDVVLDSATKLMWARNEEVSVYQWVNAKAACVASRRAGFADWRLPTRVELQSIVDYEIFSSGTSPKTPTIDPIFRGGGGSTVFTTATLNAVWTSSTYASRPDDAVVIDFGAALAGAFTPVGVTATRIIRCVR